MSTKTAANTDGQAPPPPDAITLGAEAIRHEINDDPAAIRWLSDQDTHALANLALTAAAPVLRAEGAKTATDRWVAILTEHYLMDVVCNHEAKQDNPICGCCRVFLGWHPTVGEAVQAWIGHVADLLDGDDDG